MQGAVIAFRLEDAALIHAAPAKLVKIVLWKQLPAVRALGFPGMLNGINLPVVHRHRFATRRAVSAGPDMVRSQ
jgi:hypothetical protein